MRERDMRSGRTYQVRRALYFHRTHVVALLTLLGAVVCLPTSVGAQKLRVLDADTLRSSERRDRSIDVTFEVDSDTSSASIRIGTSRWKRGGHESSSLVRFGEDIVVEADDVVDGSVVAFGGDVLVRGRVLEDVVAFGGDVVLEEGGIVEGDAAAFGGSIERAPGSDLLGEEVDIAFVPTTVGSALTGPTGGRTFWILFTLSAFVFLAIAGLVAEWILPSRVRKIAEHVRVAMWASFFVGLAAQVLLGPLMALLAVTVIGIPVALLLPLVFTVAQILGFLVVAAVVGSKFSDGTVDSRPEWVRSVLAGVTVFGAISFVAVLMVGFGGLVGTLARLFLLAVLAAHWTVSTIGLGAVTLSRFGGRGTTHGGEDGRGPTVPDFSPGTPRTV